MSVVVHARVIEAAAAPLCRRASRHAVPNEATRTEPTYLGFLGSVLRQEGYAKNRTRIAMGLKIAQFPSAKAFDAFDFTFQPSVDQRLIGELATGGFLT